MNKQSFSSNKHLKVLSIVGLVLAVGLLLSACKKQTTGGAETGTQTETSTGTEQSTQTAGAVEIKNFAFSPASITVKAGETLTITNKDLAGHSFTSDDGTSFDTGIIAKDQSKTVTAPTKPGTYAFHCTPHPNMKGTLIVQ